MIIVIDGPAGSGTSTQVDCTTCYRSWRSVTCRDSGPNDVSPLTQPVSAVPLATCQNEDLSGPIFALGSGVPSADPTTRDALCWNPMQGPHRLRRRIHPWGPRRPEDSSGCQASAVVSGYACGVSATEHLWKGDQHVRFIFRR